MKPFYEHGCDKVSTGDLLLFAYGESPDAAIAAHVRDCPACGAYLSMIGEVRAATGEAWDIPSETSVAAVRKKAKRKQRRAIKSIFGGVFSNPRVLVPAAAVLVLALALIINQSFFTDRASDVRQARKKSEVPSYLVAMETEIDDLEQMMYREEALLLGGDTAEHYTEAQPEKQETPASENETADAQDEVLDYVFVEASAVDDIEVAVNELEYEMGLAESYPEDY
ncbi:MAG: hypothetical protein R6V10_16270 [bacterium]